MTLRAVPMLLAAVLALVVGTACTNDESPVNRRPHTGTASASLAAGSGGAEQVTLQIGPDFRFHPSTFVVHRGPVQIVLHYVGSGAPHDFQVSRYPHDYVPLTSGGQTQSTTFMAPAPGRYRFVCTIHIAQGMTGTMIVEP